MLLLGLLTITLFVAAIVAISYYLDRASASLDDALLGLEESDVDLFKREGR